MVQTLLIVCCALIGSIPFSYLIARRASNVDIRTVGSGNVGATNVLRSSGKLPGLLALILDGLKGFSSVWLVPLFMSFEMWPEASRSAHAIAFWTGAAALAAVVGHLFPPWLRFRGGKGVATGAGAFLAIDPLAIGLSLVIFFLAVAVTRYVAIGSMLGAISFPLFAWLLGTAINAEIAFGAIIALLIVIRHRTNIRRILRRDEATFPFREEQ